MIVAALVPSDTSFPWETNPSWSGLVHSAVATISPVLLLDTMIARARLRKIQWCRPEYWLLLIYAVGLLGSAFSLGIGFATDRSPPWIGASERVLALVALTWVALSSREHGRSNR